MEGGGERKWNKMKKEWTVNLIALIGNKYAMDWVFAEIFGGVGNKKI